MKHINLNAYNNFEVMEKENVGKYREDKLKGIYPQINFIKEEFNSSSPLNIVEIGSGNCKMLIGLHKHKLLKTGIGIDISESRTKFAQEWIEDEVITNIKPIQGDITEFKFDSLENINLYLGLDIIWHFLNPIKPSSADLKLKEIYNSMCPGGKIILEFCDLERYINTKYWQEFSFPDPWQFSLWDCVYNEETNFLHMDKIYISRDNGKIDKKSILLEVFTKKSILNLLKNNGFKNITFFDDWDRSSFSGENFEFIVKGEK